jgi:hypothetical protein
MKGLRAYQWYPTDRGYEIMLGKYQELQPDNKWGVAIPAPWRLDFNEPHK